MSDNGWIKLHRKMLDGGMLRNGNLTAFWVWCLLKAAHKPYTTYVGHQKIDLHPGQFVFTHKGAMEFLGLSMQAVRTCLDTLKINNQITNKSTNKFSIISIVNWAGYQGAEHGSQQTTSTETNKPTTNKQQTNGFIPINKQEYKECEEEELILSCANAQAQERKNQKPKLKKETTFPATFLQFWDAYPKKRSKAQALKAWNNIPDPEALLPKILETIRSFKQSCEWQRDNGRFIPYPATWLNAAGWDDEAPEPPLQFRKNDYKPTKAGGTNQFLKMALAEMEKEEKCNKPN